MPYQVTERLYVDKDNRVYREDELTERTEAVLLATEGTELSDDDARKYGLSGGERRGGEPTAAKAVEEPPANKARSGSASKA